MSDNKPMTITEFLEARISEDEREASDAPKMTDAYDAHRAAYTPEMRKRTLAECAAKRAIIKQCEEADSETEYAISQSCINEAEVDEARAAAPGKLIREALAAVYADHPDYDPAWSNS